MNLDFFFPYWGVRVPVGGFRGTDSLRLIQFDRETMVSFKCVSGVRTSIVVRGTGHLCRCQVYGPVP